MKRAVLLSLLLCGACSSAPAPAGSAGPSAEGPTDDRVFVEATFVEADDEGGAAQGKVRKAWTTHLLVRHDTATHAEPGGADGIKVDVRPYIVDADHVRVALALAWADEQADTTLVVADRQPVSMATAKGRQVVITARIVRSDADLKAIFEEKMAARTNARSAP